MEEEKLQLLKEVQKQGLFVNADAMDALQEYNSRSLLEKAIAIAKQEKSSFLNKQHVEKAAGNESVVAIQEKPVQVEVHYTKFKPIAKDVEAQLEIGINDSDVTGRSRCKGKLEDFVTYFNDRFSKMKKILQQVSANDNPLKTIRQAKQAQGKAKIIAIVNDKKMTKNGHMIMEVEDQEEYAKLLIPKDAPLMEEAQTTFLDEVLAFEVFNGGKGILIAKAITRPGKIIQEQSRKRGELNISLAFWSDTQIGSKLFEKEKFEKMIEFIKGNAGNEEEAGRIKYITLAGDCCDGIGVYPTQERELVIKDIFKQYEVLCDYLKQVPEYIHVIVCPGNHDAVRLGEPQPKLPEELMKDVKGLKNIHLASNPSYHKIHGFETLIYHGTSSDTWVANNPALRDGYIKTEKIGVEMLRRRHLMPLYGEDPMIPENKDYMMIDSKPDIFHYGHIHRNGNCVYNGTLVVNSGTWQAKTDYQVKLGHVPTPCLMPIYNLNSLELTMKQF